MCCQAGGLLMARGPQEAADPHLYAWLALPCPWCQIAAGVLLCVVLLLLWSCLAAAYGAAARVNWGLSCPLMPCRNPNTDP
jgi:hypothetical protein